MSKASVLVSSVSAVVLVAALVFWITSGEDDSLPTSPPEGAAQSAKPNTIAKRWQWDNFPEESPGTEALAVNDNAEPPDEPHVAEAVPFDVILIYNILQDIELDANGRIVPDQTAKYALERGFDDLGPDVSPEALAELQDLIRIGLPGDAGEEAIRIMTAYYDYRRAEEEFSRHKARDADAEAEVAAPSLENYEKLVQLRRQHLGRDIADGLFAVEEVQARHMISSIAIQQNAELDDEEKQTQLQTLHERLNERLLALGELSPEEAAAQEVQALRRSGASSVEIYLAREAILGTNKAQELAAADREEEQWESHFDGFWKARQNIMQASLNEDEREQQIEQLLGQYFSPAEQERARLTSSQWQSREWR